MSKRDDWKIQELRAAALCDLNELIPEGFYANVHTEGEAEIKDRDLVRRLSPMQFSNAQLTPRQLSAIRFLDALGWNTSAKNTKSKIPTFDPSESVPFISMKSLHEGIRKYFQDALNCYASYLSEDEASALHTSHDVPESAKTNASKKDKRIAAIVKTVRTLGFDPQHVAYGGKAKTKHECLKDTKLFTDSTFDKSWQAARDAGQIEVADSDIYRKR